MSAETFWIFCLGPRLVSAPVTPPVGLGVLAHHSDAQLSGWPASPVAPRRLSRVRVAVRPETCSSGTSYWHVYLRVRSAAPPRDGPLLG